MRKNGDVQLHSSPNSSHANKTVSSPDSPFTLVELVLIIFGLSTISLITIIGNVLVMLSIKVNRNLQTVNNYFLFSLACADLFIGVFSMNLYTVFIVTGRWPLGAWCVTSGWLWTTWWATPPLWTSSSSALTDISVSPNLSATRSKGPTRWQAWWSPPLGSCRSFSGLRPSCSGSSSRAAERFLRASATSSFSPMPWRPSAQPSLPSTCRSSPWPYCTGRSPKPAAAASEAETSGEYLESVMMEARLDSQLRAIQRGSRSKQERKWSYTSRVLQMPLQVSKFKYSHRSKPVLLFSSMGDILKNSIMFYTVYMQRQGLSSSKKDKSVA